MSPQQLVMFQQLSRLFESGQAQPNQIKELQELLAVLNHDKMPPASFSF